MPSEGHRTRKGRADGPSPAHPATAAARLCRIEIENYKALDHLAVDIPAPTMPGDPDIFVVGSKNGVGKTSFLECCALAQLSLTARAQLDDIFRYISAVGLRSLVRAGASNFKIDGDHGALGPSSIHLMEEDEAEGPRSKALSAKISADGAVANLVARLFGRSADPFIEDRLLLLHSYRKVAEGALRLEMVAGNASNSAGALKLAILRVLLAKSGLLEGFEDNAADAHLAQLNTLLSTFAGGRVDKLRNLPGDQLDIRISTTHGTNFSFDSLSSGQKEIVSTLFLIWNATRTRPALVLIDEPELHLNPEWQREFIRHLHELAPQNQYILATHSEDIFASVSEERRVLLVGAQG